MESSGLANSFPFLRVRLLGKAPASNTGVGDVKDYLAQTALLNQVLSLAVQVSVDVRNGHHKYMAHQIALLYQSIASIGASLAKFKFRIEAIFDEVKTVTESNTSPKLSRELVDEITTITHDLGTHMATLPTALTDRLGPVLDVLLATDK